MFLSFFAAIRRPKLTQEGQDRVLRALHHKDRHYAKFIHPDSLALYSVGPEPSQDILSQDLINQQSACPNLCRLLVS